MSMRAVMTIQLAADQATYEVPGRGMAAGICLSSAALQRIDFSVSLLSASWSGSGLTVRPAESPRPAPGQYENQQSAHT